MGRNGGERIRMTLGAPRALIRAGVVVRPADAGQFGLQAPVGNSQEAQHRPLGEVLMFPSTVVAHIRG